MGDAILYELATRHLEPEALVPAHQTGLGVELDRGSKRSSAAVRSAAARPWSRWAAAVTTRPDAPTCVDHCRLHAQRGRDVRRRTRHPQVCGGRFEVVTIRVEVDARLLDHEHLGPQPQQRVQLAAAVSSGPATTRISTMRTLRQVWRHTTSVSSLSVPVPGPSQLGRGVVILAGHDPPAPWAGAPRVTVGEECLAHPEAVVDRLHLAWAGRQPVIVELAIDPATFRAPTRLRRAALGAGRRLHSLARPPPLPRVGQHLRRPRRAARWWWATQGGAARRRRADARRAGRRHPARRHAGLDRRRARARRCRRRSTAHAVVHADAVELGRLTVSPPPVAPTRRPRARPARRRRPRRRPGPHHRAGRLRQDPGAHRAAAPPRSPTAATSRRAVLAVAYNVKARDEMAERTAGLGARIKTLNALGLRRCWPSHSGGAAGARRAGGAPHPRPAGAVAAADGPTPIRSAATSRALPPSVSACATPSRSSRAGRRPGLARRSSRTGRSSARRGVVDFDEQVYAAVEVAARRRRAAPAPHAGRAPPPARRRAAGPHPGPRPPRPAAGLPRLRRVRGGRRRPDDLRARRRRPARSSSTTPASSRRRGRPPARGQLPLPGPGHRGGQRPAVLQPRAGWRR